MLNNRDLLTEAIADAKAVKETAIANAKLALEEAFTPHLKSMLSAKLEEMDKEDVDEGYDKYEEDDVKEEMDSKDDVKEEKEEVEEINLDELLAELELEENARTDAEEEGYKDGMKDEKEDLKEDERTDAEEEGYLDGEEDEKEDMEDLDDEDVDLEDMSEDDLKSFIEDVIKDMVEAGELEAGDEMEMDDEESDMDVEVEVEDEEEEIMEMDAVSWNDKNNPTRGASKKELDPKKVGKSTAAYSINEKVKGEKGVGNEDGDKDDSKTEKETEKMRFKEALSEIDALKVELNEVNLLNAKLLYTNKIFKAKNLSEGKKVKVLKAFDKATTVKEAKVIFETLNEGLSSKMTKTSINEVKGSASKAMGMAPTAKQPIVENAAFARMQKLAGIIKN
jgi:hypothetical protein|tara:strand:- start:8468 stop:9646 length:1179 start_codon:yes stop_codon:yes gene_type:complete